MSCKRFDRLISLFLDGRLDQKQERELKDHLSRCERCGEKLSVLQSVEEKARRIEAEEPPEEYWQTFSSRVREKILARQEKTSTFSLTRALESVFSFSPLKIKVAAGVISVALVFVIGKLYVDYRGEEIPPSERVVKVQETSKLDIAEMEMEEESPPVERIEEKRISEKPETAKEGAADRRKEVAPSGKGEKEKGIPDRGKEAPPAVVKDETASAPAVPAVQIPVPVQGESEKQAVITQPKSAGAGVDKKVEKKRARTASEEETDTLRVQDTLQALELENVLAPQAGFVSEKAHLQTAVYRLDGISIPKIGEADTMVQTDTLDRVTQVWKAYVERHPADSLSQEGYSQIATAYYLLARASQDTSVISEGSKLIEQYISQTQDPANKDDLNRKLKQIQALKQK